jgi:hypothetical protein
MEESGFLDMFMSVPHTVSTAELCVVIPAFSELVRDLHFPGMPHYVSFELVVGLTIALSFFSATTTNHNTIMNQHSITSNISVIPEHRHVDNSSTPRMQDQITAIVGGAFANKQSYPFVATVTPSSHLPHNYRTDIAHVDNAMHDDRMSSSVDPHMTTSSLTEVDLLLDHLVNAIHIYLQQEKLLDRCIREQVQLTLHERNRDGNNQLGVILHMHQVNQMQMARERVRCVIQLLQDHIDSIESQLETEQTTITQSSQHTDDRQDDDDMMI